MELELKFNIKNKKFYIDEDSKHYTIKKINEISDVVIRGENYFRYLLLKELINFKFSKSLEYVYSSVYGMMHSHWKKYHNIFLKESTYLDSAYEKLKQSNALNKYVESKNYKKDEVIKYSVPGIYIIHNTINNRAYIGSSNNIQNRWQNHRLGLRNNKHTNERLQKDWNEYGEERFNFAIVETFYPINSKYDNSYYKKLWTRETEWINKLSDNIYNLGTPISNFNYMKEKSINYSDFDLVTKCINETLKNKNKKEKIDFLKTIKLNIIQKQLELNNIKQR